MKRILCVLIFIFLAPSVSFSKNDVNDAIGGFEITIFDSILHKTIYRISIADYQQVELIEFNDGQFKGYLSHLVWAKTKTGKYEKGIIQKIKIPDLTVKKLINDLQKANFETILASDNVEGCMWIQQSFLLP